MIELDIGAQVVDLAAAHSSAREQFLLAQFLVK